MQKVFETFYEFKDYLASSITESKIKNLVFNYSLVGSVPIVLELNEEDNKILNYLGNMKWIYYDDECKKDKSIEIKDKTYIKNGKIRLQELPPSDFIYVKKDKEVIPISWKFDNNRRVKVRINFDDGIEEEDALLDVLFSCKEVSDSKWPRRKNIIKIKKLEREEQILHLERVPNPSGTLYVTHNTYNLERQLQAFEMLRNEPYPQHLPLLKLALDTKEAKWDLVDNVNIDKWRL